MHKYSMRTTTFLAVTFVFFAAIQANAQSKSNPVELEFLTHVGQGIVEQDVFIERVEGSGELYRIAPDEVDQYADSKLFGTKDRIPYEPFDPVPGGPYAMGVPLGVTLREWLAAEGTGSYWCENGTATITTSLENLVPNGLYTVWYVIRPDPPTNPFTGLLSPMGNRDGTQGTFTADKLGRTEFEAVFEPCLEMSGLRTLTVVGIALHSDGKTYGSSPGLFGKVTHTQLNAFFPKEVSADR